MLHRWEDKYNKLVCMRDHIFTFVARLRMPSCQLALTVIIILLFVVIVLYTLAHILTHTHTITHLSVQQTMYMTENVREKKRELGGTLHSSSKIFCIFIHLPRIITKKKCCSIIKLLLFYMCLTLHAFHARFVPKKIHSSPNIETALRSLILLASQPDE